MSRDDVPATTSIARLVAAVVSMICGGGGVGVLVGQRRYVAAAFVVVLTAAVAFAALAWFGAFLRVLARAYPRAWRRFREMIGR